MTGQTQVDIKSAFSRSNRGPQQQHTGSGGGLVEKAEPLLLNALKFAKRSPHNIAGGTLSAYGDTCPDTAFDELAVSKTFALSCNGQKKVRTNRPQQSRVGRGPLPSSSWVGTATLHKKSKGQVLVLGGNPQEIAHPGSTAFRPIKSPAEQFNFFEDGCGAWDSETLGLDGCPEGLQWETLGCVTLGDASDSY